MAVCLMGPILMKTPSKIRYTFCQPFYVSCKVISSYDMVTHMIARLSHKSLGTRLQIIYFCAVVGPADLVSYPDFRD